jgi:hypothetical protein
LLKPHTPWETHLKTADSTALLESLEVSHVHGFPVNFWFIGSMKALVGFNQQNALLAPTDSVQFWMLARVDRLEIERVIKFLHLQKLS